MASRVTNEGIPSSNPPKQQNFVVKKSTSSRDRLPPRYPRDIQELLGDNWTSARQIQEAYERQLESDKSVISTGIKEDNWPSTSKAKEAYNRQLQGGNSVLPKAIKEDTWSSASTLKEAYIRQLERENSDIPKGPQENFELLFPDDTGK